MSEHLHPIDIILAKRDGKELSGEQIENFIADVVSGDVTDARLAAFLMAVFQRGLTRTELAYLTSAMRFSGEVFDAAISRGTNVDKHSTGGIGDKTSLLLAPVAAAAGLCVPMISGRSLGHSGGTLDKLETIPGYNTQLTMEQFGDVIRKAGCSIIGQTERLVPADRILYAMRDHTGTVESPFLICASIMSKKLAAGLNALVLDVKTGSGAFMKKVEDAEFLASLLVSTGELAGTRTGALLTTVDQPLGRFSGNWIEVWECVDIMKGIRHPFSEDLIELTIGLAGQMLFLGGKAGSAEEGERLSKELLHNGKAWEHWLRMVEAHGGERLRVDRAQGLLRTRGEVQPAAGRDVDRDDARTLHLLTRRGFRHHTGAAGRHLGRDLFAEADGRDVRNGPDPTPKLLHERRARAIVVVPRTRKRDAHRDDAARIEARLHAAQVTEALEHEARRRKQDEGEGDLPRDEHTARRDPATAGRERPRPFTEGEYVHPGIGDRDEGQDGPGDHRQRTRDRHAPPLEVHFAESRDAVGRTSQERVEPTIRDRQA